MNTLVDKFIYELDQIDQLSLDYQMEVCNQLDILFQKEKKFYEYEINSIIQEGAVKSEGFGTKIINFIRKIFQAIYQALSKMVNSIIQFFNRKKGKGNVNPNTIASQIVSQTTASIGEAATNGTSMNDNTITITIPSSTRSDIRSQSITIQQSDINVIFSGDGVIEFKKDPSLLWGGYGPNHTDSTRSKLRDEKINDSKIQHDAGTALSFICDKTKQDNFIQHLSNLCDTLIRLRDDETITNDYRKYMAIIKDTIDEIKMTSKLTRYNSPSDGSFKTTINEIRSFQTNFNNVYKKLLLTFDPAIKDYYRDILEALADFGNDLAHVQMSLNSITNSILQSDYLNKQFWGTISDAKTLARFVKGCISAGLPPKFMMFNTWLISSDDLRGGTNYDPIWGQSRGVFFPISNTNVVYKFALSGWGVSSNKTECDVTQILSNTGDPSDLLIIPKVLNQFEEYTLLEMERLDIDESRPGNPDDVSERFENAIQKYNTRNHRTMELSINDLHSKNVGYDRKRNCDVIIDYGWGSHKQYRKKSMGYSMRF